MATIRAMGRHLALLLALLPACTRAPEARTVTVFAASSLAEAFADLESAYEAEHPGVDVQISYAGSQVLRLQIQQGARAEVFASANPEHVEALHAEGLAQAPTPLAANQLVVIVPPDSPLTAFSDLPRAERLVVGTPTVPVGRYTRLLLDRAEAALGPDFAAAVRARVVSEETNVRLVRAKVELGEADAAIVYRTYAVASERVRTIPIPGELQVEAAYTIAAIGDPSEHARGFLALVSSPAGQRLLAQRGFVTPSD